MPITFDATIKSLKGFRTIATLSVAGALILGLSGCTHYDTSKPSDAREAATDDKSGGAAAGSVDCREAKCIALTFDAGPSENSPRLLDILKAKKVHATFFLLGKNHIDKHPDLVERMAREGHELASHTWDHKILTEISDADVRDEFKRTDDAVEKLTGKRPTLVRPPQGRTDNHVSELAEQEGLAQILWDVTTKDYKVPPSKTITERAVQHAKRDSIILLHDIYKNTVPAVPAVIDQLKAKGYTFVTVPQLLAPGRAEPGKIYKP